VKTRLFFVSDVHGSESCFRKFINAAKFYGANILILGGDITGKTLVPVVEQKDGRFRLSLHGEEMRIKKDELQECLKMLRNSGTYYFMTNEEELSEIVADRKKVDQIFLHSMKSVLESWVDLANERLKGTGVTCYISPGNDDKFEMDEILKDKGCVVNPENRVVQIEGGYEMITLGYANPTPWKSPREIPEDGLLRMIETLASKLGVPERSIFNLHVPPLGTEIDRAPAVDSDLRYEKSGLGMVKMTNVGSSAVRSAIEKYQPMLGLHGHVHESRGFVKVGRTLCINPGSDYGEGILRGAIVDLIDGKVEDFVLTSG
jgi:Icc-related predicted phosphoesterase